MKTRSITLFTIVLITLLAPFKSDAQSEFDLSIKVHSQMAYWEPITVEVKLINITEDIKVDIISPPHGQFRIREKGTDTWNLVAFRFPQGRPIDGHKYEITLGSMDTLKTWGLIIPAKQNNSSDSVGYLLKPNIEYEIMYSYQKNRLSPYKFPYVAYSSFFVKPESFKNELRFLEKVNNPLFLFQNRRSYDQNHETYLAICREIIVSESPILKEWAALYLYRDSFSKSYKELLQLSGEEYRQRFRVARNEYFEFEASVKSPFIKEALLQQYGYPGTFVLRF